MRQSSALLNPLPSRCFFFALLAVYSLVARGDTVLAEQTAESVEGNFATVTRVLLKKIPTNEDSKQSYAYDEFVFHYSVHAGLTLLCMCEKETSSLQAFRMLAAAEADFLRSFGGRWHHANAYKFDGDFKNVLGRLMNQFSAPVRDEKVGAIQDQLGQIKGVRGTTHAHEQLR